MINSLNIAIQHRDHAFLASDFAIVQNFSQFLVKISLFKIIAVIVVALRRQRRQLFETATAKRKVAISAIYWIV